MKKIARFIASAMLLLGIASSQTSCLSNLTRPAVNRFYNGAVINASQYNLWVRCINPPQEFGPGTQADYTRPIEWQADGGMSSYYLPQRVQGREPGFKFEATGQSGNVVARFEVWTNGIQNDSPYEGGLSGLDWWYEYPSGRRAFKAQPSGGDR